MTPKIYLVGGAVRDKLLGRESNDRDYVVVGATPEWMLSQGFKQVGKDFPVYLHPETGEEYALARQERKTGPGYHGFETTYDPSVTLEDDLVRRDLTINAMAMDEDGTLIDPYGGQHDLAQGILRHVSNAFADDPLRVLRLARFAARYEFRVTDDTIDLARNLVYAGELEHLPKSRIWNELMKGMSEKNPGLMIEVLTHVGAIPHSCVSRYFPPGIEIWTDTANSEMFKTFYQLSTDVKYLITMAPVEADLVPYEASANELCIPGRYVRMAKVHDAFIEHVYSHTFAGTSATVDEMMTFLEKTKFVVDEEKDEMKAVIKALKVVAEFADRVLLCADVHVPRLEVNLEKVRKAAAQIRAIDMKAVADAGDKSQIKARVSEAKKAAVMRVFEEENV